MVMYLFDLVNLVNEDKFDFFQELSDLQDDFIRD
jgi:hypothetical protein